MVSALTFQPRGAALAFWQDPLPARCPLVLFEGPAGTGKSYCVAHWLHQVWKEAPRGATLLVLRQTLKSLRPSVQKTYEEKILAHETPYWRQILHGASRSHRDIYRYPNGGEWLMGGLDDPGKWDSVEADGIWIEEAKYTSRDAIDQVQRCLRNNVLPFQFLVMTTNPGRPDNWINETFPEGVRQAPPGRHDMVRLLSRHEDNPMFDSAAGQAYLARLRNLHGAKRAQLYEGRWHGEEGLVWPEYEPEVHLVDGQLDRDGAHWTLARPEASPIRFEWYAASLDFGFRAPGCFMVFGITKERKAYCVCEVYRAGWRQDQWCEVIAEAYRDFPFRLVLCDSEDPEFILQINAHLGHNFGAGVGAKATAANKSRGKQHGLDCVRWALASHQLYFLRPEVRCRYWPDPNLKAAKKPTDFGREAPAYVFWSAAESATEDVRLRREKQELPDPTCANHACDAVEYFCTWHFGPSRPDLRPPDQPTKPGFPDVRPPGVMERAA